MELTRRDRDECARQFVKSFVYKNRQERLFEIISKDNWRKFAEEIFYKPGEHNLNEQTTLFFNSNVTLIDLAELCPQIAKAKECCVLGYQKESACIIRSSNLLADLEKHFETTCILSFVLGEVAVYCSEYNALCYYMKGFNGMLAKHPKFRNIIDNRIYR